MNKNIRIFIDVEYFMEIRVRPENRRRNYTSFSKIKFMLAITVMESSGRDRNLLSYFIIMLMNPAF